LSLWSARITVRNIAKMIESFYNLKISPSTINNCLCNVSSALEPLIGQIRQDICASKTAHFDETKYSIHGSTGWVWTGVSKNSCYITVEKSRGTNVLQKHFSSFAGVAVCDGWMPYHIFEKRQRCWAHILREARYTYEKLETENSESLYLSLQKLFHSIKDVQPSSITHDAAVNLFEKLVSEHSNESELEKFLNKLNNAKDSLFTFLLYEGIEPTNNTAERALRESVINRKIRGCVRNQKGCTMFGNLMSCIMTWKMRNCNILDEIVKYV
jgi:transposase